MNIRWKLKEVMAIKKISNKELAKKMGKHINSISHLKRQKYLPALKGETLAKLCEILNCDLLELIELTE